MSLKILAAALVALAAIYAGGWALGAALWKANTQDLWTRINASRSPVQKRTVDFQDLEGLPAPVQRYLRTVLVDGQPIVTQARLRQTGTFNMDEAGQQWKPFTAEQWVSTCRPSFLWNARISMLPGLHARVHDAYVAGEGVLHASLLGLVSVADQRGKDALAEGELMRYFAEAAWYPTGLLPSQGVSWAPAGDHSAYGTLADGDVTVRMLFSFNDEGLLQTVYARERGRMIGEQTEPTPWRGRFWNYETRDGMRVPLNGEVAWLESGTETPYWRGRIAELDYTFAP
jgi:hypothetical protein